MCGRYTLTSPEEALHDLFGFEGVGELTPRYNVAPTQDVPAVRVDPAGGARELVVLRWGLVPFFAKDPSIGARMINARAETAAERPSFRAAFRRRRCLIPADGFVEWTGRAGAKRPFHVTVGGGRPFAMAGLYEHWKGPQGVIRSCTILTCQANELLAAIHDRMPVIVPPDDFEIWLDPGVGDSDLLHAVLRPYPADSMAMREVSRRVNDPRNDDPGCLVG